MRFLNSIKIATRQLLEKHYLRHIHLEPESTIHIKFGWMRLKCNERKSTAKHLRILIKPIFSKMKEQDLIVGSNYHLKHYGIRYKLKLVNKTKSHIQFVDESSDMKLTTPYTGKHEGNLQFITPAE